MNFDACGRKALPFILVLVLALAGPLWAASALVGVDIEGAAVQDTRNPRLSRDGRFVLFYTKSAAIVPGDTNGEIEHPSVVIEGYDAFLRDRITCRTERVSLTEDGGQVRGDSGGSAVSGDGRFVVFASTGDNLPGGQPNIFRGQVYVRDRVLGTTEIVSVSSQSVPGNGGSGGASMSQDGRFVAFYGWANNLVPDDTNPQEPGNEGLDVFVHDRLNHTTVGVSRDQTGSLVGASGGAELSGDGSTVVFVSRGMLVPDDTNGDWDLYARSLGSGSMQRVNVGAGGEVLPRPAGSAYAVSFDGSVIAFVGIGDDRLWVYDTAAGHATQVLDTESIRGTPTVSGDGTTIGAVSVAGTLASSGPTLIQWNRTTGEAKVVATGLDRADVFPAISADGMVFATGRPVRVHGEAPAVPTSCEAGADQDCDAPQLAPIEKAACMLSVLLGPNACEGMPVPDAVRLKLEEAQAALERAAAAVPSDAGEAARWLRAVRNAVTRAGTCLRRHDVRFVFSPACAVELRQSLRALRRHIRVVRRALHF